MTDNDIIKALEYCTDKGYCSDCPYCKRHLDCKIEYDALDLINRQKAEIESLQIEVSKLKKEMSYMINPNTIGDRHEMGRW